LKYCEEASYSDLERLEVILSLTRELGVNLAGVEIILNMRAKMDEMRREFERFFEYLKDHASEFSSQNSDFGSGEALIPVSRSRFMRVRETHVADE
jgi:MerR family transcriptional regulator, heat shock protein HspR